MAFSKKIREQVYNKYDGHCAYCGKKLEYKDMQVDHFIPQAYEIYNKGSVKELFGMELNDIKNLMPACRRCNYYKQADPIDFFRKAIAQIPRKLYRDSFIFKVGVDYGIFEEPKEQDIKFYFEQFDGIEVV